MDARPEAHPADSDLQGFAQGKLDAAAMRPIADHLQNCPDCRRRVAELPCDIARIPQAPDGTPVPPDSVRLNAVIGANNIQQPVLSQPGVGPPELAGLRGYEIVRKLEEGGMGVVYLARNTVMDRLEVLKVLNKALVGRPEAVERFLQEIRAAAQLIHANVATAFAVHQLDDSLILAMEYIDGADLAKVVRDRGQLPIPYACYCIHQAALALQGAADMGLVHRDIKPSNILLSKQGKRPVIKVIDFGLAKARSEIPVGRELTVQNQMMGTPGYSAPEQLNDAKSADIRSDIYALGCTLYCLLAGEAPFKGSSAYAVLLAQAASAVRSIREVRPEVSEELAAIVSKMMAREPAARFQRPSDVAVALAPFIQSSKSSAEVAIPAVDEKEASPPSTWTHASLDPVTQVPGSEASSDNSEREIPIRRPRVEWTPTLAERLTLSGGKQMWLPVAIGVGILIGVFILIALVASTSSSGGTVVIENVPTSAVVRVDGDNVLEERKGQTVTIKSLRDGPHRVTVSLGGRDICVQNVTIGSGNRSVPIRVSTPTSNSRP
jgi:serine/threonine protein kinase